MRRTVTVLSVVLCTALASAAPPDGKALFKAWCASCHGPKGLGDGPAAAGFDAKPGNLAAADYKRGTTDKAVLKVINKGVPGTPMDGYESKLDEGQRKALVDYLKVLRGGK